MTRLAVGIDLGGTKASAGLVDDSGTVLRRTETASRADDLAQTCETIAALVASLSPSGVVGVGVGAAGLVDFHGGRYRYGPNLGLRNADLAGELGRALRMPVVVDNDANAAAWAEHRFGAGRGTRHFLCVTLGTGIGGGIVIDGRPYRGAHGGAAEIGHMLVDPDGPPCGCGRRGCWEQLASGRALERAAREALADAPDSLLYARSGGDPARLHGRMVTEAAREGDALSLRLLDGLARWVGWGIASLVNVLEPERVAVSGGLAEDWDLFGAGVVRAFRERVEAPEHRPLPEVVRAELGADAGIVGAAWLALEQAAGHTP